jgi:ketosteroid isomerase-like protein
MITHTDIQPEREIQIEREGLFAWLTGAFMHRNFVAFDEAVREDVVTELAGSSWLAGTHRGREAFGRHIVALRQILRSTETATTYLHGGNQMIVRHEMLVTGPKHQVEMVVRIKIRFDADGKIASSELEPEDLGLFDHVANSTLKYFDAL